MVLREFSLWYTYAGVQESLAAAWIDLDVVVEPKTPWVSSSRLCFDMLSVRFYQLGPASTWCTFWRFLGREDIRLEGLIGRSTSPPEPLKPAEGLCTLVSCSMHDPIGGVVDSVAFAGQR